ncbi:MAG: TetR/AcrR family transcriptional regulator [Candidatus Promineifilaceae bacterium]|nr:TetR/AcrR family transcriptional regulator [Candidatus Promineifilaceae bacterium]
MIITEPTNRRDRRIAARQEQILEAAAHVFSQNGYERATMKEIAQAADVSEGTLYNYFDNKIDLLNGVARTFADEITEKISTIESDNLEDMMAQLLTDRFRSGRERRLFMLFLYEARLHPEIQQYYSQQALQRIIDGTEKRFRELIKAGVMRPVDPALAARTISAAIMGFATLYELGRYGGDDNGFSPEKWGAQVTDIFLNGLAGEKSQ